MSVKNSHKEKNHPPKKKRRAATADTAARQPRDSKGRFLSRVSAAKLGKTPDIASVQEYYRKRDDAYRKRVYREKREKTAKESGKKAYQKYKKKQKEKDKKRDKEIVRGGQIETGIRWNWILGLPGQTPTEFGNNALIVPGDIPLRDMMESSYFLPTATHYKQEIEGGYLKVYEAGLMYYKVSVSYLGRRRINSREYVGNEVFRLA